MPKRTQSQPSLSEPLRLDTIVGEFHICLRGINVFTFADIRSLLEPH
jgi:hypothetical protein